MGFNKRWIWKIIGTSLTLVGVVGCGSGNSNSPGTISGVVNQGSCQTGTVSLAVYSGTSLVQQTSVNPGAGFSFGSINPGTYTVGAQNQTGCGAQGAVTIAGGQTGQISLTLSQGQSGIPAGVTQFPNGLTPTPYPSTYPGQYPGYPTPYPSTHPGYPGGYYPTPYPSAYPGQYYPGYPQGYIPNGYYPNPYAPTGNPFYSGVTYPYNWMLGPSGYGYYYWSSGSYVGPCTMGGRSWICQNTF